MVSLSWPCYTDLIQKEGAGEVEWKKDATLTGGVRAVKAADVDAHFRCGLWAFSGGRYGEAYSFFSACGETETAVCFNLALTLYRSALHREALLLLDKAAHHMPTTVGETPALPFAPPELERLEDEGAGYLQPMPRELPLLCPTRARYQLLRLKAEVLLALELYGELRKLLPLLARRPYARLMLIEHQLNGG